MHIEQIGINAGVVWKSLESGKELTTKELKKITKFTEKDVAYALGWLAREGKVYFREDEKEPKDLYVSLA